MSLQNYSMLKIRGVLSRMFFILVRTGTVVSVLFFEPKGPCLSPAVCCGLGQVTFLQLLW